MVTRTFFSLEAGLWQVTQSATLSTRLPPCWYRVPRWQEMHLASETIWRRGVMGGTAAPSAAGTTNCRVGLSARTWMTRVAVEGAGATKVTCGLPWSATVPMVPTGA